MTSDSRVKYWVSTVLLTLAVLTTQVAAAQTACCVVPVNTPGFPGVSLTVANSVVPPGGTFQYQLLLTEPKPIGNSSSRPTLPSDTATGIALNDPIGETGGVAVVNSSGIQITTTSQRATFGTSPDLDYPILAIAVPIPTDAVMGSQFPLSIDLASTFWLDPFGQPYPQEIRPGKLTIGGSINISNVVPGGGFQPAGAKISIFGMGFTPDARVAMEGVSLATTDYTVISANRIDVVLPDNLLMDGVRVRVKNKAGESVQYFSYLRAQPLGVSGNPLVNQCYPLFARKRYTSASLAWTPTANTFTALAAQNPGTISADITVELRSATNAVLGSFAFPLPPMSKITRDLTDYFPQAPPEAVSVHVSSTQSVQLLGVLGDAAAGTAVPVMVTVP